MDRNIFGLQHFLSGYMTDMPTERTSPPSMVQYAIQQHRMQIHRIQRQHKQQHPMNAHRTQEQTLSQPGLLNQQPQITFFQTHFQPRQNANRPLQPPIEASSVISNEDSAFNIL